MDPWPDSAGLVQILRAAQKDQSLIDELGQEISQLLLAWVDARAWAQWRDWIQPTAAWLYCLSTTLANCQTVGEEYSGILQLHGRGLPSGWRKLVMVLLYCWGPLAIQRLWRTHSRRAAGHPLPTGWMLVQDKLNLALFFLSGRYYHWSKRLCAIRYGSLSPVHGVTPNNVGRSSAYLGLLRPVAVTSFLVTAIHELKRLIRIRTQSTTTESREVLGLPEPHSLQHRCSLCLEARQSPTATPCGHLFCWTCIFQSLEQRPDCPVCRITLKPTLLVPILNGS